jgi:NTP pyrophosphatase (non-canonical NTP hydrolase)
MSITINELFEVNLSRALRWHPEGIESWSALEWAGAMAGEAGEAANAAKKLKRLEGTIVSLNSIDEDRHYTDIQQAKDAVAREVADTIIYGFLVLARVGVDNPEKLIQDVFNWKSVEYGFPEMLNNSGGSK